MMSVETENCPGHGRGANAASSGEEAANDSRRPHRRGDPVCQAGGAQDALQIEEKEVQEF